MFNTVAPGYFFGEIRYYFLNKITYTPYPHQDLFSDHLLPEHGKWGIYLIIKIILISISWSVHDFLAKNLSVKCHAVADR